MPKTISTSFTMSDAALRATLLKLQTAAVDLVLNSGGLALKTSSSALAKTVNTIYAMIDGVLVSKAAADMAALSGTTLADGDKNVYVFTVNASGTLATYQGTKAATIGGVVFPTIPSGEVVIGFVYIATSGATFVPGTTALDAGTVTAVYVNTPYPFNPNALSL